MLSVEIAVSTSNDVSGKFSDMTPRSTMAAGCRRGAASVEFAVCLPVVLLIVFGTIEACSLLFLQQNLHLVAYETARVAAAPYQQTQDASAAGQQIMEQLELVDGTVVIEQAALPGVANVTTVTAVVTLPLAPNRLMPQWALPIQQLSARCGMVKEREP
jgi:Flp pilus assembly protein TadG